MEFKALHFTLNFKAVGSSDILLRNITKRAVYRESNILMIATFQVDHEAICLQSGARKETGAKFMG